MNIQHLYLKIRPGTRGITAAFWAAFAILCLASQSFGHDRPHPENQPTRVALGLFLLDVLSIDDSNQTVTIDFGISATWNDPKFVGHAGEVIDLDNIWAPNLQFLSNKTLRLVRPEVVHIGDGGQVSYLQRYIGEIWHSSDLSDFPFDTQTFSIQMITPLNTPNDIEFVENKSHTGESNSWSLVGWNFLSSKWALTPYFFEPSQETYASASYVFTASRKQGYYFWKVLIPLSLVVLMSGAVFWIDASNTSSQISVGYTAILTLVAYRFLIGHMVPEISYLTRLDIFIFGASILVFLVLGEAILTGRLTAHGKINLAIRIDRCCRAIFISAFIAITLIAFVF